MVLYPLAPEPARSSNAALLSQINTLQAENDELRAIVAGLHNRC